MAYIRRLFIFALLLTFSLTLGAETTWSITPNSGPTSGGQEVIVKGNFGSWPYGLIFGSAAVPATRIDDTTLSAITPPHPPGTVDVVVFEYDIGINTDLKYTFVDDGSWPFERVLLPILLPPIPGAHGSEFRTEFRTYNRSPLPILTYGLVADCSGAPCADGNDRGIFIGSRFEFGGEHKLFWMSGSPGAFFDLPRDRADDLSMQLRAYDVSREATNFGTEIPVVRQHEMRSDEITLLGVPTDTRFRNTLRIYSTEAQPMHVLIESASGQVLVDRTVFLSTPGGQFDPAYAAFIDFPANAGIVRVRIWSALPEIVTPPVTVPDFWAFITVTNNDTQHITVISPQR